MFYINATKYNENFTGEIFLNFTNETKNFVFFAPKNSIITLQNRIDDSGDDSLTRMYGNTILRVYEEEGGKDFTKYYIASRSLRSLAFAMREKGFILTR